jgi:hypothetical protein
MTENRDKLSEPCRLARAERAERGRERRAAFRAACRTDAQSLCAQAPRGRGQLRACLREQQDKLSQPCRIELARARSAEGRIGRP